MDLEEGTLYLRDAERPLSEASRVRLYERRAARARPGRDDKVLAGWNGLMIAALSRAAGAFERPDYALAAARAARFVLGTLRDAQGGLLRRWRDGEAAIPAFAEDYAYLAWGLLELYEAGFEPWALEAAFALADRLLARHADPRGGFFRTRRERGRAVGSGIRLQPSGDGALPSANSVALLVLLKLSRIGDRPDYWQAAEALLRRHSALVRRHPQGFAFLLVGLDFFYGPSYEVVLAGSARPGRTRPSWPARFAAASFPGPWPSCAPRTRPSPRSCAWRLSPVRTGLPPTGEPWPTCAATAAVACPPPIRRPCWPCSAEA